MFTLFPPTTLSPKMSSTFYVCCIFQVHFRLDIIMKAKTMNPGQTVKVYLYPANNLVPENVVYYYVCCNIQMHFRQDFIVKANTMNPDQTVKVNHFVMKLSCVLRLLQYSNPLQTKFLSWKQTPMKKYQVT